MLELEVEEGPNRGARYALVQGSATIGRDVACEVSVIDERASRKHAKLELTREGALTVEDQGSRNGTLLNGLPLEPGVKAPLAVGDRIAIGGTTLLLTASPGAALASSPTVGPTRAIRPLVAPGEARPAGASGPRDPARVLSLLQKLGALLSSGAEDHDPRGPLGCALAAALEVAGGERAALLAAPGEKAPVRVLAATHDPPPGLPQDALLALSRTGAIELDTDGSSLVAVSLPGRKDERHAALVVAAATGARADAGAWAAVASALAPHVAAAEEARERRLEAEDARRALKGSLEIVAESPSMRRVLEQAAKAASGSAGVLILGESGSGKELVARAIHAASARAKKRFVAVNASAFPETLLESELFGHERGAFTGAVARRKGLFELADRGTLFLDEVAELALATQPKLLRVLETGEVRPLGGSEALSTDVRILAATNKDLRDLVRKGLFREDLYFRLAVVELRLPPLRERLADLAPLVRHLLSKIARRPVEVEPAAIERLSGYSFPGNVRELRNILERALLAGDGRSIRAGDLPADARGASADDKDGPFPSLADAERAHIEAALRRTGWNRSRAAKLLGIDRKTLYLKVKALGLRAGTALVAEEGDEEEPA